MTGGTLRVHLLSRVALVITIQASIAALRTRLDGHARLFSRFSEVLRAWRARVSDPLALPTGSVARDPSCHW